MFWLYWQEFYNTLLEHDDDATSAEDAEESEQHFPGFMDQSWCLWHPVEGCVHFSDNWQNVSGLAVQSCEQGALFNAIHAEDHAALFSTLESMVLRHTGPDLENSEKSIECRLRQPEGDWRWFECRISYAQKQTQDEHPMLLFALRDIQKLVELKQQAASSEQRGAYAEKGRKDFLTHMSHELRTPLNAILGFSQVIQSEAYGELDCPEYKEYVEHIRASGEDLLIRIENLLEMASVEAEPSPLKEAPINLCDVLAEAVTMHSHRAFERQVQLRSVVQHPGLVLNADKVKLLHALGNLIHNALAHAPEGSEVRIGAHVMDNNDVALTVDDVGPGIAPIQLEAILDALQNERSDHDAYRKAVGVGLMLANHTARLHGGQLELRNRDGRGCRATLKLPASRVASLSAKVKNKPRLAVNNA